MKVKVIHQSGRSELMAPRLARVLEKMGRVRVESSPSVGTRLTRSMEQSEEILASDAVREYAAEKGIDLNSVGGSGASGRITKKDIDAAVAPKD